jgi:hypothetical protein
MTTGTTRAVPLLVALLEAEHAALYGYGLLGARLDDEARPGAQAAADAHRSRRDRLEALVRDRGGDPPDAAVAYDVSVGGQPDAVALAARLEDGLSTRYLDLVGGTDDPRLRRFAVDGLTEAAVRAASWRRLLGERPGTQPFPGRG